jgi:hypothetical protein
MAEVADLLWYIFLAPFVVGLTALAIGMWGMMIGILYMSARDGLRRARKFLREYM